MIVRDVLYSLSEPDFRISFQESYHVSWNFAECRYCTNFKWPYFRTAGCYGHAVGHAGSHISIAHTDMTLTWPKVKVKLTDLLLFRKLDSSTSNSSAVLAWRSQFIVDYDSMRPTLYNFLEPDFWISPSVGGHVTSKFAICWYHQNSVRCRYYATSRVCWRR